MEEFPKKAKKLKEEILRLNVHAPSRFKTKREMCIALINATSNAKKNYIF